jgi:hypothetical protein
MSSSCKADYWNTLTKSTERIFSRKAYRLDGKTFILTRLLCTPQLMSDRFILRLELYDMVGFTDTYLVEYVVTEHDIQALTPELLTDTFEVSLKEAGFTDVSNIVNSAIYRTLYL